MTRTQRRVFPTPCSGGSEATFRRSDGNRDMGYRAPSCRDCHRSYGVSPSTLHENPAFPYAFPPGFRVRAPVPSGYNRALPQSPPAARRAAGLSFRKLRMKILVGYKRVVDYNVRIQVKPDGSGVVTDGVKLSANPFDDIALEEALRLRDKGIATEVIVATIGPADSQAHLRNGLAMGANRAIHVVTDQAIQPLTAARAMLKLIEKEQPGLVLMGKQAIDDDANQTGQMLATLWGRPQATFASKLEVAGGKATVTREVDAGLETLEVDLPAVVTTDLRLNEPRFIKLPDIMKAKSKPLETIAFADLGVDTGDAMKTTHYAAPAKRSKGVMVKDAAELVAALKAKGLL